MTSLLHVTCFQASGLSGFEVGEDGSTTDSVSQGGGGGAAGAGGACSAFCVEPPQTTESDCDAFDQCTDCGRDADGAPICVIELSFPATRNATVDCPDGLECQVRCVGDQACQLTDIYCPMQHRCTVLCEASGTPEEEDSCQNATIHCGDGPCAIECGAGKDQCTGTTVDCGINECSAICSEGGTEPSLDCDCDTCKCERCSR